MPLKFKLLSVLILFLSILFMPLALTQSAPATTQNFGSKYVFNADDSTFEATAPLSSNKYVIAFRDANNGERGVAMVANVSGRTITYGPKTVFDASSVADISVAAINSLRFSIVYADGGSASQGTIITGTIGGGDAITFTPGWVYSTGAASDNSISRLNYDNGSDTGWMFVGYEDAGAGTFGRACVVSVVGDGTDTDLGSRTTFNAAVTRYVQVSALTTASAIVVFQDQGDLSHGKTMVATIVGYIPTFGAEYTFSAAATSENKLTTLNPTTAVVAYRDNDDGFNGKAKVLSVAGDVVTVGNEYEISVALSEVSDIIALSSTSIVVSFESEISLIPSTVTGSVSGLIITFQFPVHYYGVTMSFSPSLTSLTSSKFAVSYRDDSNSYFGTSMIADLPIFNHPSGTLVQVKSPYSPGNPAVYRITGFFTKSWINSEVVFNSQFSWSKVVPISQSEADDFNINGGIYPYRDCELVKEASSPAVYVFDEGQKRHILSPTVFDQYHFSWGNIVIAPNGSLADYTDGADLAAYADDAYPNGCLLKAYDSPYVYVLDLGNKRHIPTLDIFNSQFFWSKLISVSSSVLSDVNYPVGPVCPYSGGELVKEASNPAVYVFENGSKRHILTLATFEAYDYSWANLRIAQDGSLAAYPDGADLTI